MRMTRGIPSLAVLVAVWLLQPSPAHAVCNGTTVLGIPDGSVEGPETVSNATNDAAIFFSGETGNSYSVAAWSTGANLNQGMLAGTWGGVGIVCPTSNITGAGLRDTSTIDPAPTSGVNKIFFRASFTAPQQGGYYMVVRNGSATPETVYFSVTDTTMYSPAWSTNGSYDTYYSMFNTTRATCSATLSLQKLDGSFAAVQTFTIGAHNTAATNTVALGMSRNVTGTAKLTHDCPPGALLVEAVVSNFTMTPPYTHVVKFEAPRSK